MESAHRTKGPCVRLLVLNFGLEQDLKRFQEALASVSGQPCEIHLKLILANRDPGIFSPDPEFTAPLSYGFSRKAEPNLTHFLKATMELIPVAHRIPSAFIFAPSLAFPRFVFPFLAILERKAPQRHLYLTFVRLRTR
jgi:hypothetical protein